MLLCFLSLIQLPLKIDDLIFLMIFYQIRNSAKLKKVMQTILSLGNALNQGTARGKCLVDSAFEHRSSFLLGC